jgi:hypothetical protein
MYAGHKKRKAFKLVDSFDNNNSVLIKHEEHKTETTNINHNHNHTNHKHTANNCNSHKIIKYDNGEYNILDDHFDVYKLVFNKPQTHMARESFEDEEDYEDGDSYSEVEIYLFIYYLLFIYFKTTHALDVINVCQLHFTPTRAILSTATHFTTI